MAKWLSVRLRAKWLWVRVPLQSLKLTISHLFRVRNSLNSRNSRVLIYSETRTWHNKNIQSCFWYWEFQKVTGFTKSYFYKKKKTNGCLGTRIISCVVIILLNTGLWRCAFSNISSEKLVFGSPVLSAFFILNKKFI